MNLGRVGVAWVVWEREREARLCRGGRAGQVFIFHGRLAGRSTLFQYVVAFPDVPIISVIVSIWFNSF